MMQQIFVSSVQKELQAERYAIRDFVHGDELLRQFFRVFLFEDLPPADRRPDDVYLEEVAKSEIYVGVFGREYGREGEEGKSPTEREFAEATRLGIRRLILAKGYDDEGRHPKMTALLKRAGAEVLRRRFETLEELRGLLYGSLVQVLREQGSIQQQDFDAAPCVNSTLQDISEQAVRWFVDEARVERQFALEADTAVEDVLTHLDLMRENRPTHGAVLLFGKMPQRHIRSSDLTCLHFHGTEVVKPIPSQQVYRGTLFETVDKAVDFVMARLSRSVVPGKASPRSSVSYEIPFEAVREAIVNAVAHRDYASRSGVQVSVFADRIEVWNPGGLIEGLTTDQLRVPHASIRRNQLLCDPLYLAHYIERAGTGTLDMIRLCREAGLPEPEFHSDGQRFVTILWRQWLTDGVMDEMGLTGRQRECVRLVMTQGRIDNAQFRQHFGVSRRTAGRELADLVDRNILERVGTRGRGVFYRLRKGAGK